ncbi:hypothetical protein MJN76_33325, partial [Salmonella enterica subsp. enterica serovar Anatum]|nr:hypothetical protein [Salmonella enterica subsp. enterica serovar Anatum]
GRAGAGHAGDIGITDSCKKISLTHHVYIHLISVKRKLDDKFHFPQEAAEFTRRMKGDMPADFDAKANEFIAKLQANPAKIASRK